MRKRSIAIGVMALVIVGIIAAGAVLYARRNTPVRVRTKAATALSAGNYAKALKLADSYIARRPDDWRGYRLRGNALLYQSQYDEAREAFRMSLKREGAAVDPALGLAATYSLPARQVLTRQGDSPRAKALDHAANLLGWSEPSGGEA